MSMKQIETLVFDYGGVIVNIDDASVVKAMESLGVTAFKRLIHVRKIKRRVFLSVSYPFPCCNNSLMICLMAAIG